MNILTKEQTLEIKKRLAKKMNIDNLVIDWVSLSGEVPLWNLTKLQDVYEDFVVINDNGRDALLNKLSDYLSMSRQSVLMFPADGFIINFDFKDLAQSENQLQSRPIINVDVLDLKKTNKIPKWFTPEDIYFFDEDFSWILFLCHERFQIICGSYEFISRFKEYWQDYKNYIDDEWSELFKKT